MMDAKTTNKDLHLRDLHLRDADKASQFIINYVLS